MNVDAGEGTHNAENWPTRDSLEEVKALDLFNNIELDMESLTGPPSKNLTTYDSGVSKVQSDI